MFIQLNSGYLLNVSKIGYVYVDGTTIVYKLTYGEEVIERFDDSTSALEKYEMIKQY